MVPGGAMNPHGAMPPRTMTNPHGAGAGEIGSILGGFVASIILPVVILIICNFIAAAKSNPKIVYGICVVLAVAICFVSVNGGGSVLDASLSAVLAIAFLGWGYIRAARKLTAPKSL